ncbi:GIY-YIG nuclease family protein [Eubacterium sp. An3]|uniref:GIY-YIG nuclease family protein n=1 Tax=Eubacterium sp. An3 TaxID=1965628 RepID=UPI001FA84673|nr:GIY-YIG nuclease family protein [Eubacterium sp. An3]
MNNFSEKSLLSLGDYYVYGLIDPRNKQIFYIGKGTGNRVFEHERESIVNPDSEKLKLKTIADIKSKGLDVEKIIINSNLTEAEAFAAEASLINAFNYISDIGLSNIVSGHHSSEALSVEEYEKEYGAVELQQSDIRHLCIGKSYSYKMWMCNFFSFISSLHIPPFQRNHSSHCDANIGINGCPFHLYHCCCDHFFSGSQKTSVMSKTRAWGNGIPIKMKIRKCNSCQNGTTVKHGWILLFEKEPLNIYGNRDHLIQHGNGKTSLW